MDLSFISNIFLYAIYCVYAFILFYYTSFHHSPTPPPFSFFFSLNFQCILACKMLNQNFAQFYFIPYQFGFFSFLFGYFSVQLSSNFVVGRRALWPCQASSFSWNIFFFEFDFVFFVWIRNCLYMRRTCAIYIRWRNVKKTYAVSGERVRWMCSFKQSNENQNWYDSMEYYVF